MASKVSFRSFLRHAFEVMDREFHSGYQMFAEQLGDKTALVTVDRELSWIHVKKSAVEIEQAEQSPDHVEVQASTSRACILSLVEGKQDWLGSLVNDELDVVGDPDDVLWFLDSIDTFLRVAVRCPSMPYVLECYYEQGRTDHA